MQISLSQKERMLLEDQKTHEQICIQKYSNYANQAKDTQLKQIFNANEQSERTHLDSINQLLNGNIPQMNQQQNQGSASSMNNAQQTAGSQGSAAGMVNTQAGGGNVSDKDMCTDVLMTEKYVSGAYDTAIFEFKDTRIRDVLNHIQKEEQKHGEAVFQYMQSKGLYNVQ
jgi:spore coat protein CotF